MGRSYRHEDMVAASRRAEREREELANALATVEQFNERLAADRATWFWPTIGAALATKHHWLVIACDSCETMIELDLRMKRRDPNASIQVALSDIRCSRCNGHGKSRLIGLAKFALV